MDLSLIISVGGFVLGIGAGFAAYGRLDNKVANLEKALDDEIKRNSKQHDEFYVVKYDSVAMQSKVDGMSDRLKEVEVGIKEILSRLPAHRRDTDS